MVTAVVEVPKKRKTRVDPLGSRVVVKRLEALEKTPGGVVLPDASQEKPREGKVIEVGPGRWLDSGLRATMTIKVGDRIVFAAYGGTEIKVDGEELLILDESDCLAILTPIA